jgi:3-isopropylmalate/(R)-2-methylmalate dehydratase small subunit
MEPVVRIASRTVVLAADNVDTDQIIPARFLTGTRRDGLGAALFADWRRDSVGELRPDFPLNRPEAEGARILVAGANFGCGSSREHAPWALTDYGFAAVVSPSIADIFKGNAVRNGLVPVELEPATHGTLVRHPGAEIVIDVEAGTVTLPDGDVAQFELPPFARRCLLTGRRPLDFLLDQESAISSYEQGREEIAAGRPSGASHES